MATSFEAKDAIVRDVQLRTQELVLPYVIVGNVTPASVVVTADDPSVLFIETESTSAVGSSDISALITSGETYTAAASVDLNGEYNAMVKICEKVKKVKSIEVRERFTGAVIASAAHSAPSDGIISFATAGEDDAIVFQIDHGASIAASTVDAVVVVRYEVE